VAERLALPCGSCKAFPRTSTHKLRQVNRIRSGEPAWPNLGRDHELGAGVRAAAPGEWVARSELARNCGTHRSWSGGTLRSDPDAKAELVGRARIARGPYLRPARTPTNRPTLKATLTDR